MKTVGLPKRLTFDMGPYFIILSSSHFSAVLALIARRRIRLWPIIGSPSEPGGNLFDDLLLRRKKMEIEKTKMVNEIFIFGVKSLSG